jgi:hypothetical protein
MKLATFALVLCALVGLAGCFLPLVANPAGGTTSFWDLREVDLAQTLSLMCGYAVALSLGIAALVRPPLARWHAIVIAFAFTFVAVKFGRSFYAMLDSLELGARLMGISAIAGAVIAAAAAVKAERATS